MSLSLLNFDFRITRMPLSRSVSPSRSPRASDIRSPQPRSSLKSTGSITGIMEGVLALIRSHSSKKRRNSSWEKICGTNAPLACDFRVGRGKCTSTPLSDKYFRNWVVSTMRRLCVSLFSFGLNEYHSSINSFPMLASSAFLADKNLEKLRRERGTASYLRPCARL